MPDEKVKWPSNSNASKSEQDTPEKREAPKLKGSATVKKKNLATKFAEAFVVDDVKNVGKSLVYDILIPAIKDTISKMVSNGVAHNKKWISRSRAHFHYRLFRSQQEKS